MFAAAECSQRPGAGPRVIGSGNISVVPTRTRAAALRGLGVLLVTALMAGCGSSSGSGSTTTTIGASARPARYTVHVIQQFPHDVEAFTQGLVWAGTGQLYESTGLRGQSTLRKVAIPTGQVEQSHSLDERYFGEGLALVDDQLIQLTWQENTAFVYQAASFDQTGTFSYATEGWGLCYDGTRLVMSDGTSTLTFRNPDTFDPTGTTVVQLEGTPLAKLNELECVGDRVYANVLGDDNIYEIDPSTGVVTGVVDASSLYPEANVARGNVLNGMAYDPDSGHFYVTGKRWPTLYEVTFDPAG